MFSPDNSTNHQIDLMDLWMLGFKCSNSWISAAASPPNPYAACQQQPWSTQTCSWDENDEPRHGYDGYDVCLSQGRQDRNTKIKQMQKCQFAALSASDTGSFNLRVCVM